MRQIAAAAIYDQRTRISPLHHATSDASNCGRQGGGHSDSHIPHKIVYNKSDLSDGSEMIWFSSGRR